ncbi:hypothetical protein DV515_00002303 [Chloebia gouldiae]|uniref:Protein yippee-like n=1 Tax=Chloebia gouldiae TaxID=44316 RepID=A0A3L8SX81_CHLGU|nr:hypothetical protein DV515_00002303 [Chloebia gouldiae]
MVPASPPRQRGPLPEECAVFHCGGCWTVLGDSTYYLLFCRSCGLAVGFILYSSGSDLAHLRDLFCFFKDRIMCYLLKNQIIIEASKVNFPAVTLKESVDKVKKMLVDFSARLELVTEQLNKITQ